MKAASRDIRTAHADGSGFALLRFDHARLAVPQSDLRILDLALEMDKSNPPVGGVGWIRFRQTSVPVYGLSGDLAWSVVAQEQRPICAILQSRAQLFGILCSDTILLKPRDLVIHDLPAAMAAPHLPYDGLARRGDALVCLSSAEQLLAYLPQDNVLAPAP